MDLNILWFILIAVLYGGFFFLEGFDFGVGMLLTALTRKDVERRAIINTIGPHWDGNEVWLIVAGGATFAAFPHWYATMFSGFYLGFFLLLFALIVRGVAFEFRSKHDSARWRYGWDRAISISSFLAAFLLGVVFTNLVRGVPINQNMQYTGTFWNLLNPIGLLGGLTMVILFCFHGASFLSLKLTDGLRVKAQTNAKMYFTAALVFALGLFAALFFTPSALFVALFPNVMLSSSDPANSLTIYNAASSPYTLRVLSIIAAIMVPVVAAYQVWTYIVFKKRVKADAKTLTY